MKRLAFFLLFIPSLVCAKDMVQVQVVATHSVTHEAQDNQAIFEHAILGVGRIQRQVESFNLDTVINGEHVRLTCDDPKGCESVAPGTYAGELWRGKKVRVISSLPLSAKEVKRWYKISGSW